MILFLKLQIFEQHYFPHYQFFKIFIYGFLERDKVGDREREIPICCYTFSCTHWLILVCALTRD